MVPPTQNSGPVPKSGGLSKACPPGITIARARQSFAASGLNLLADCVRIDGGRLGIPVYLSLPGPGARALLPAPRQMGKGATPEQAEASALMELAERFSFFSFRQRLEQGEIPGAVQCTFNEAMRRFGPECIPLTQMLASVGGAANSPADVARAMAALDLLPWRFVPATRLSDGGTCWLPVDWFCLLNEFNGASAGNTQVEAALQGAYELVERHVCCRFDRERPLLPAIDRENIHEPTLRGLLDAFAANKITLLLKDMSMGLPVPTVAALAWDPATFPEHSEIVFTAGTAASPVQAAIRAVTEAAQLAGDFCTDARYEASGLPKFTRLEDCADLWRGAVGVSGPACLAAMSRPVALDSLPNCEQPDLDAELRTLGQSLEALGFPLYSVDTTHPALGIPAQYAIIPGFGFRERDRNASIGLFVGKALLERFAAPAGGEGSAGCTAALEAGFHALDNLYPGNHYTAFFRAMAALRGNGRDAAELFALAAPLQPDDESRALAEFYCGYAHSQRNDWAAALDPLRRAVELDCRAGYLEQAGPEGQGSGQVKEYHNLLGVALFKAGDYANAVRAFTEALRIDRSSAPDLANLGICHKRMGDAATAKEFLAAALALDSELDYARRELEELGVA